MKRTKKLLSFFLAIMMVITVIPAFTITSNAATQVVNKTISVSKYAVMASSSRNSGTTFNICNDGRTGNFSIGIVQFDISNIVGDNKLNTITSANYSVTYRTDAGNSRTGNMNLVFYYPTTNFDTFTINSSPSTFSSGTAYSTIFNTSSSYYAQQGQRAINHFGLQSIKTITTSNDGTARSASIDITSMLNYFMGQNMSVATLMFLFPNCDSSQNSTPWTDTSVTITTGNVSVTGNKTVYSTTASAEDNANSVTNRLIINDAIYTYQSSSAYYNYGTVISTDAPWCTKVVFRNGFSSAYLSSIICLDNGETLSLDGNGYLQGNLVSNKFKVSGATDVNATLLFTFTDGAKEYHRVAVKSYPVENHIGLSAEKEPGVGSWTETAFTMFLRGSTGSGGTNGVWKYQKSYYKSGTTGHGFPDKDNNSYTADKNAFAFKWSTGDAIPTVSKATYYIDKSCKGTSWEGLGNSELWNGSNYVIDVDIVRTKYGYDLGGNNGNFDLNNMPVQNKLKRTNTGTSIYTNANGTTHNLQFTHSASVSESNRWSNANDTTCNLRVALRTTDWGYAVFKTNMVVNLFDKSVARSKYDELINKNLKENDYTASSFATYQNALMNMEAFLSNYEDTTTSKTSDTVYTALVDAYNGLQKRTTGEQYQELLALDQQLKTAKSYAKSEPIDTPYTASSYSNFRGALVSDPTGQAESDLADYQAGRKDLREFSQSTYTTYKNAYNAVLSKLVERADFGYYDEQLDAVAGRLSDYTAKDGQYIRLYSVLEPYKLITPYTTAEKLETKKTAQTTVNNVGSAIANANTGVYNSNPVDQTALQSFIVQNFDLDVVDNSNIKTQKDSAKELYQSVTFNGNEYWSLNVANQAELDSNIARYINSINSTLGKYDIKVPDGISVAVSGQTQTPTSTTDGISTYRLTYGVPVTFTSSNADTAWYMSYVSNVAKRGMQYQCSGETYATKVMGNMTVTPKSKVENSTPHKVTVVRQYSNGGNTAMLIDYVGNSFTLPAVQTYPNYTFTGYEVAAGSNAKIENGTVTGINGDTVIYAKYDALGSDCAITITKTDGTTTTENYKYNSVVNLSDSNAYAWIVQPVGSTKWTPAYIGTDCPYRITEAVSLKAVASEDEMKQLCGNDEAFAPNLRANGPLVVAGKGIVFHGQFINYVPANAEIVEYGVLVYKGNSNDFDLTSDKSNIIRCKSTNPMKSNQFSVGALYSANFPEGSTISYKSYMIYQIKENGTVIETKYVYSDVRHFPENA